LVDVENIYRKQKGGKWILKNNKVYI
jgi:hypothetical protein